MEQDVHGAPPASTRAAPRSPASTSTSSSAAAATTRGARPRPARTSSTRSPSSCASPTASRRLDALHLPRPVPADGGADAARTPGRRTPADPTPRRHARRCAPTAPSSASSPAAATVDGKPVAYTQLRSTYFHEVDSALGFSRLQRPRRKIHDAARLPARRVRRSATRSTGSTSTTDAHRLLQLRRQPGAAAGVDPRCPCRGRPRYEWKGFDPDDRTRATTRRSRSTRRSIDQDYITSWNNKQAPRLPRPPTATSTRSVYRSQLLDDRIRRAHRRRAQDDAARARRRDGGGRRRSTCAAQQVLPLALRVIGTPERPGSCADAVRSCAPGSPPAPTGATATATAVYEHADAIRIMDAWWPRWCRPSSSPCSGDRCSTSSSATVAVRQRAQQPRRPPRLGLPGRLVRLRAKDLRTLLGDQVARPLLARYCGNGDLRAAARRCGARCAQARRRAGDRGSTRRRAAAVRPGRRPERATTRSRFRAARRHHPAADPVA